MKLDLKKRTPPAFCKQLFAAINSFFSLVLIFAIYPQSAGAQEFNMNSMPPPKMSMEYSVGALKDGGNLAVSITIPEKWHVNANEVTDEFLKPSEPSRSKFR